MPSLAYPKGPTTKQIHAKRARAEQKLIHAVRPRVLARDGCRMAQFDAAHCFGRATWAHCEGKRRHQTMRQPPEARHSDAWTIGLCVFHSMLEELHQLLTEYLTDQMARGPMAFILRGVRYEEQTMRMEL